MAKTTSNDKRDWYLARFAGFEQQLNGASTSALHKVRRKAIECFAESGFPTSRDEDWKHTNLAALTRIEFQPLLDGDPAASSAADIDPFTFAGLECTRLVFLNGLFAPHLSTSASLPPGVQVTSLATALEETPEKVEPHLGRYLPYQQQGFAALNTAFLKDGAFIYIPPNTELEVPIHLLFVSRAGEQPSASFPRNLIVVEPSARASVIETYAGFQDQVYLTNTATEAVIGANAALEHCKIQRESSAAFHIAALHFNEARDSRLTANNISLGGRLTRNDITTLLDGEAIESTLNGLYLMNCEQHVDNHTLIEHARPNCASHELYKGILADRSTGVFRGKIHVHQDAQKTNAYQSNQNLLLSDKADITSKPQLEIYADDVKCSHGSTTGQLDQDAVFYLRARGLGKRAAINVLTRAFAGELLERIGSGTVRNQLEQLVSNKLEAADHFGETT